MKPGVSTFAMLSAVDPLAVREPVERGVQRGPDRIGRRDEHEQTSPDCQLRSAEVSWGRADDVGAGPSATWDERSMLCVGFGSRVGDLRGTRTFFASGTARRRSSGADVEVHRVRRTPCAGGVGRPCRPGRCSAGWPTSRWSWRLISCCWRASSSWARSSSSAGSGAPSTGGCHVPAPSARPRGCVRGPWGGAGSGASMSRWVWSRVSSRSSSAAPTPASSRRPDGVPHSVGGDQGRLAPGLGQRHHQPEARAGDALVPLRRWPGPLAVEPAVDRREPGRAVPGVGSSALCSSRTISWACISWPGPPGGRRPPAPRRPAAGRATSRS